MVVLDEIMTFVLIFIERVFFFLFFYFDPRVTWGRLRHRKSILFDRKVENLPIFAIFLLDRKIDLLHLHAHGGPPLACKTIPTCITSRAPSLQARNLASI